MNLRYFMFLTAILFINIQCNKNVYKLDDTIFSEKQDENKVLSQYYRWFQTFEREQNEKRISNHLKILSDDVYINTSGGSMNGKDGMRGFLNYIKDWKNAHHVKNTNVIQNDDGTFSLEADILYQNILPDSTKNNFELHYSTILKDVKNQLPIFTKLELLPTNRSVENIPFKDAYIENRSKSFIYYWISLADDLNGNEMKFKELLASNFSLQLPNKTVKNYKEFQSWIVEMKNQFYTSIHIPKNIKSKLNSDGTINVSFDIEWKGLMKNGEKLIAEIHHVWTLENDFDEPYAKMKEMRIKQTNQFQTVKEF